MVDSDRESRQVAVQTGSRLHFGLLDTVAPFGGTGVMIDQPMTEVAVLPAKQFHCESDDRARVEAIALRLQEYFREPTLPAVEVQILRRARPHCGLGSGTQLSLAIAEAICHSMHQTIRAEPLAVAIADRGRRSAIGIHGYFQGGMIVEAADETRELNPVKQRIQLPTQWTVLVVRPRTFASTVSGDVEREHFAKLAPADSRMSQRLQSLMHDRLTPAAIECDFPKFCDALHQYNRLSGQLFAAIQGGPYNGAAIEAVVNHLIHKGACGVGQSSWGPGVFSWFERRQDADAFARELPDDIEVVAVAHPTNQPRTLIDGGDA